MGLWTNVRAALDRRGPRLYQRTPRRACPGQRPEEPICWSHSGRLGCPEIGWVNSSDPQKYSIFVTFLVQGWDPFSVQRLNWKSEYGLTNDNLTSFSLPAMPAAMKDYLVVVQAPAYRVKNGVFASESAFVEHLRTLRGRLHDRFRHLLLCAPSMNESFYSANKDNLSEVDEQNDGIVFVPMHGEDSDRKKFWGREVAGVWKRVRAAVEQSAIVHTGISDDLWRPSVGLANVAALLYRRPVIWHVDIDSRRDNEMGRKTGLRTMKRYIAHRLVYDPIKHVQLHLAPRLYDLVLLKSGKMVADVGRGAPNVRNFYDTVHSEEQILKPDAVEERVEWLRDRSTPLRLVFFGRLVAYKGLDRSIETVRRARELSGRDIRLTIIGGGEEKAALETLIAEHGLQDAVEMLPAVKYGDELFTLIRRCHLHVATPLMEDTPRAAFDALSQGVAIAAFGIQYYLDLEADSSAVVTATWPSPEALAQRIIELDADRDRLVQLTRNAIEFSRRNTQDRWLDTRMKWAFALLDSKVSAAQ